MEQRRLGGQGLVERGVRFVQIYSAGHQQENWDAHTGGVEAVVIKDVLA